MKKVTLLILIVIIITMVMTTARATDNVMPRLSELSDEECIEFLLNYGVEIPAMPDSEMSWIIFIRTTIMQVEENPYKTGDGSVSWEFQFVAPFQIPAVGADAHIGPHIPGGSIGPMWASAPTECMINSNLDSSK